MGKYLFFLLAVAYGSLGMSASQLPGNKYFLIKDAGNAVNFLSWLQYNTPPPKPPEKYERKKHFGIWIDFPNDNSCLTTRGLVLERETKAPIELVVFDPPDPNKPPIVPIFPNACYVAKGHWYDNYTDAEFTESKVIEIDHVVPLKYAYLSGAFEWNWRKRCAYFNFLGTPAHLMPIEANANTDKLDHGPDRWMPPNKNYHCQYISNWLKVKAIWQLRISDSEAKAITDVISTFKCSPDMMKMTKQELMEQRKMITEIAGECPDAPPPPKPAAPEEEII